MRGTNKFERMKKQNGSKIIKQVKLNRRNNNLQEILSHGKARINMNIQTRLNSNN